MNWAIEEYEMINDKNETDRLVDKHLYEPEGGVLLVYQPRALSEVDKQ